MTTDLHAGVFLGGCRIKRPIGRGGMGVVYLAEQVGLGRDVALKVIVPELSEDLGFRQRFDREARMAASLDHPSVVTVHEAGEDDGQLYLVMRYIDGLDLRQHIVSEGAPSAQLAVSVISQVASALDAAHSEGLVHRDIKPANILVARGAHGLSAYLSDFGLTKHMSSVSGLTQTGNWVGTADYVAPEQIQGERVDARTDVYALGCVLHEALTGWVPYPRDSDMAKMWAHVNTPPPRPTERRGDLPAEFDEVVQRALAKNPDQRFPSAGDLARAAQAALANRTVTEPERSVATGQAAPIQPMGTAATAALGGGLAGNGRTKLEPTPAPSSRPTRALPPRADKQRRWLPALIIGIAVLALAGAATALVVAGGGSSTKAGQSNTVTVQQPTSSTPQTPAQPPPSGQPGPAGATSTYTGGGYTASYPSDWTVSDDNKSFGSYFETRFVSPDGGQSVAIDRTPGSTTDPEASATQLAGNKSTTKAFGPVTIAGKKGFEWAFTDSGNEKVDFLFNDGGDGYAVLGKASPADFAAVSKVARQVAESVTPA
jgi:serine/threonine protein kinase